MDTAELSLRERLRQVFASFGVDEVWRPVGGAVARSSEEMFVVSPADFAQIDEPALHYALSTLLPDIKFAIIPKTQMVDLEAL